MDDPCAAANGRTPVVVQVERIDVGALRAEQLLEPQGLATADLDRLAGTGLERCSTIDVIAVREGCANAVSCDDFARPLRQDRRLPLDERSLNTLLVKCL